MTIEERAKAAEAAVLSLTAERDDLRKTVEASVVNVSAELDAIKVPIQRAPLSFANTLKAHFVWLSKSTCFIYANN